MRKIFAGIVLVIFAVMATTSATELQAGQHVRMWVDGGDTTVTYIGVVDSVEDTDVIMTVTNSASQYAEQGIAKYYASNPVYITRADIFAWCIEPEAANQQPGFGAFAAVLILVGCALVCLSTRRK